MAEKNISTSMEQRDTHLVPVDSNRNQILAARKVMTRSVTLAGEAKYEIPVPKGCYEVNIKSASAVTFYESLATYTSSDLKVDGTMVTNTYGTGYNGTLMTFPIYNQRQFWLNGTGVVTLMFSSIGE